MATTRQPGVGTRLSRKAAERTAIAVEHLEGMGFEKDAILDALAELRKVGGGGGLLVAKRQTKVYKESGWEFIKQDEYSVVVDNILHGSTDKHVDKDCSHSKHEGESGQCLAAKNLQSGTRNSVPASACQYVKPGGRDSAAGAGSGEKAGEDEAEDSLPLVYQRKRRRATGAIASASPLAGRPEAAADPVRADQQGSRHVASLDGAEGCDGAVKRVGDSEQAQARGKGKLGTRSKVRPEPKPRPKALPKRKPQPKPNPGKEAPTVSQTNGKLNAHANAGAQGAEAAAPWISNAGGARDGRTDEARRPPSLPSQQLAGMRVAFVPPFCTNSADPNVPQAPVAARGTPNSWRPCSGVVPASGPVVNVSEGTPAPLYNNVDLVPIVSPAKFQLILPKPEPGPIVERGVSAPPGFCPPPAVQSPLPLLIGVWDDSKSIYIRGKLGMPTGALDRIVTNILSGFHWVPTTSKHFSIHPLPTDRDDDATISFESETAASIFLDACTAEPEKMVWNGHQLTARKYVVQTSKGAPCMEHFLGQVMQRRLPSSATVLVSNVPPNWRDATALRKFFADIVGDGPPRNRDCNEVTKLVPGVYSQPELPDVFVQLASESLADALFYRCGTRNPRTLEILSSSTFICRHATFVPLLAFCQPTNPQATLEVVNLPKSPADVLGDLEQEVRTLLKKATGRNYKAEGLRRVSWSQGPESSKRRVSLLLASQELADALMEFYVDNTAEFSASSVPLTLTRHGEYVRPGAIYARECSKAEVGSNQISREPGLEKNTKDTESIVFVRGLGKTLTPAPVTGALAEAFEVALAQAGVLEKGKCILKHLEYDGGADFAKAQLRNSAAVTALVSLTKPLVLAGNQLLIEPFHVTGATTSNWENQQPMLAHMHDYARQAELVKAFGGFGPPPQWQDPQPVEPGNPFNGFSRQPQHWERDFYPPTPCFAPPSQFRQAPPAHPGHPTPPYSPTPCFGPPSQFRQEPPALLGDPRPPHLPTPCFETPSQFRQDPPVHLGDPRPPYTTAPCFGPLSQFHQEPPAHLGDPRQAPLFPPAGAVSGWAILPAFPSSSPGPPDLPHWEYGRSTFDPWAACDRPDPGPFHSQPPQAKDLGYGQEADAATPGWLAVDRDSSRYASTEWHSTPTDPISSLSMESNAELVLAGATKTLANERKSDGEEHQVRPTSHVRTSAKIQNGKRGNMMQEVEDRGTSKPSSKVDKAGEDVVRIGPGDIHHAITATPTRTSVPSDSGSNSNPRRGRTMIFSPSVRSSPRFDISAGATSPLQATCVGTSKDKGHGLVARHSHLQRQDDLAAKDLQIRIEQTMGELGVDISWSSPIKNEEQETPRNRSRRSTSHFSPKRPGSPSPTRTHRRSETQDDPKAHLTGIHRQRETQDDNNKSPTRSFRWRGMQGDPKTSPTRSYRRREMQGDFKTSPTRSYWRKNTEVDLKRFKLDVRDPRYADIGCAIAYQVAPSLTPASGQGLSESRRD